MTRLRQSRKRTASMVYFGFFRGHWKVKANRKKTRSTDIRNPGSSDQVSTLRSRHSRKSIDQRRPTLQNENVPPLRKTEDTGEKSREVENPALATSADSLSANRWSIDATDGDRDDGVPLVPDHWPRVTDADLENSDVSIDRSSRMATCGVEDDDNDDWSYTEIAGFGNPCKIAPPDADDWSNVAVTDPNGNDPAPEIEAAPLPANDPEAAPRLTFATLFSKLPTPFSWSIGWQCLMPGSDRPIEVPKRDTEPDAYGNKWWINKKLASLASWRKAHFWNGIMSKGKGDYYNAGKAVVAERVRFVDDFKSSLGFTGESSTDTSFRQPVITKEHLVLDDLRNEHFDDLNDLTAPIHRDMLKSLDRVLKMHEKDPKHLGPYKTWLRSIRHGLGRDRAEINLLQQIYDQHVRLFKDAKAGSPARMVTQRLKYLLDRGVTLSEQSYRASALVAQLTMDQTTIARVAGFEREIGDSRSYLLERQNSKIQKLRNAPFYSVNQIDRAFRAISYITNGLKNPNHKLNKVLIDSSKISGKNEVASSFADLVSRLDDGETVTLRGGWKRGFRLEWVVLGAKKTGFFGATPYLGIDEGYDYDLIFEKVNGELKVGFQREGVVGINAGASAWGGFGIGDDWFVGGTAALQMRAQFGNEDRLNIVTGQDGLGSKEKLSSFLKGEISDPFELLGMSDRYEVSHFDTIGTSLNFILAPELAQYFTADLTGVRERGHLHAQLFACPVVLGFVANVFESGSRKGYDMSSEDGIYNATKEYIQHTPWSEMPEFEAFVRSDLVMRMRMIQELSPTAISPEGRLHGGAATGVVSAGISFKAERRKWREIGFWAPPKPVLGDRNVRKNEKGGITGIGWTMTLPRKHKTLNARKVKDLIEKADREDLIEKADSLNPQEREQARQAIWATEAKKTLIEAISYTNKEKRDEIGDTLERFEAFEDHPLGIEKEIEKIRSLANFTRSSDRRKMNRLARNLVQPPFKKLSRREKASHIMEKIMNPFSKSLLRPGKGYTSEGEGEKEAGVLVLKNIAEQLYYQTLDNKDGTWQSPSKRSKKITLHMEASPEEIRQLQNESVFTDMEIGEGMGHLRNISTVESRSKSTGFSFPVLIQLSSSASLKLSKKVSWTPANETAIPLEDIEFPPENGNHEDLVDAHSVILG